MREPLRVPAEDELLLDRCLKKDPGALRELVTVHGESLYGFVRSALGRRAVLTHPFLTQCFADLLRDSNAFNLTEPIRVKLAKSFLVQIQKQLKQKHSEGPLPGLNRRLSVLFTCLSQLSWDDRVVILLRDQLGFSLDEMQAVLSKTEQETRLQIQEARIRFREQLQSILKNKKSLSS